MTAKGNSTTTDKIVCTSRPNCPCKFCGQVRLLVEHERQRCHATGVSRRERIRAEAAEIHALAEQFVAEYLERKEKP